MESEVTYKFVHNSQFYHQLIRVSHGKLYTVPSTAMEIMHLPSSNTAAAGWSPIQLLTPLSLLNFSSPMPTLDTLHHALKPKELAQT